MEGGIMYPFIKVKIIADSISQFDGIRLTTFELEYPRYIHAEIMTHRVFSRNAQSSRAVPVDKQLERVRTSPVLPIEWGANKSGMSSATGIDSAKELIAKKIWQYGASISCWVSEVLSKIGLHKQWANRGTEPYSTIKVVITATEWDNFFWLRYDKDAAQPEIVELARLMQEAMDSNTPLPMSEGEWHTPYVEIGLSKLTGERIYYDENHDQLTLEEALKISASCCAQVSYRRLDTSKAKAIEIYDKLFSGPKPHLSPVEHQATPVLEKYEWGDILGKWPDGVTHLDREGNPWSANFKGWIQYRQLLGKI